MKPIISIVIPCFNSELTLESTLQSVLNQDFQNWEAIIVNDGSKDSTEDIALKWIEKDNRFKYYSKQNEGLGKTRNFGIDKAKGIYILPLDSDNLVEKDFIKKALNVFENNPNIGVIHGDAEYFGEKTGIWKVEPFCLEKMLIHNYIDACAIFKKELWVQVGGYDEEMPYQGHEDWDFWISFSQVNVKFYHLNQVTFNYYVSKKSMIHSFSSDMILANQDYIVQKHSRLYHEAFVKGFYKIKKEKLNLKKEKLNFKSKLESEKFIINLFSKRFFGFTLFNIKE